MAVKLTGPGATERLTYSVPEAATFYGISRAHAFALARKGELPGAIRLGGRIVVSRRVLERVLDGGDSSETA